MAPGCTGEKDWDALGREGDGTDMFWGGSGVHWEGLEVVGRDRHGTGDTWGIWAVSGDPEVGLRFFWGRTGNTGMGLGLLGRGWGQWDW